MKNENNNEQVTETIEQPKIKNKKVRLIIYVVSAVVACLGLWFLANAIFVNVSGNQKLPDELADLDLPSPREFENMSDEEKAEARTEMIATMKTRGVVINEELTMENPEIVSSGKFKAVDTTYRSIGEAKILRTGDIYLLRLERFEVTNGPALHVLLSSGENPTNQDGLGEHVDLGELKGDLGNQNYSLDGIDVSKYKSVVIYSSPFSTVYSVASLK